MFTLPSSKLQFAGETTMKCEPVLQKEHKNDNWNCKWTDEKNGNTYLVITAFPF